MFPGFTHTSSPAFLFEELRISSRSRGSLETSPRFRLVDAGIALSCSVFPPRRDRGGRASLKEGDARQCLSFVWRGLWQLLCRSAKVSAKVLTRRLLMTRNSDLRVGLWAGNSRLVQVAVLYKFRQKTARSFLADAARLRQRQQCSFAYCSSEGTRAAKFSLVFDGPFRDSFLASTSSKSSAVASRQNMPPSV